MNSMPKEMAFIAEDLKAPDREPTEGMVFIGYLCQDREEYARRMRQASRWVNVATFLSVGVMILATIMGTWWLVSLALMLLIFDNACNLGSQWWFTTRFRTFEIVSATGTKMCTLPRMSRLKARSTPAVPHARVRSKPNLGLEVDGELKIELLPIWKGCELREAHGRVPGMVTCFAGIYAPAGTPIEEIGHLFVEHLTPLISQTFPFS